jgi:hypothetical protein
VGAFDAAHAGVRDDGGAVVSTLYETVAGATSWVPRRPVVVKSRRNPHRSDAPWWVIYPDDSSERWLAFEDAVSAAHAWCDEHVPYSHERLTNG